ncbi:hypothetical protein ANOM_008663, partial [Aspergillus nomiae NRRL 13137]
MPTRLCQESWIEINMASSGYSGSVLESVNGSARFYLLWGLNASSLPLFLFKQFFHFCLFMNEDPTSNR